MSKEVTIKHTYKLKRGKEEALVALNPMLLDGEPIVSFMEDGSVNMKVGDGVHTYNELDWIKGDDTPTVPFIDLGYIGESDFNNALDTLSQMDCIGVCHIAGPSYTAYFEQWITHLDDDRVGRIKQTKKLQNCGFVERYKTLQSDGTWLWSDWQPITIDIIDTGNHFESTNLNDVLNQLGNNQVIGLGAFTSNSALSGYAWEEGKHYRFYLEGYPSGYYIGHCKYEELSGYSTPVLYLHSYTDGTDYRCELRHGHKFYSLDPYSPVFTNRGENYRLADILNTTKATEVTSFDELLTIADQHVEGRIFCINLKSSIVHPHSNPKGNFKSGMYICMNDYHTGLTTISLINITEGIFYRCGTYSSYFTAECIFEKQDAVVTATNNYFNGRRVEAALQELHDSEYVLMNKQDKNIDDPNSYFTETTVEGALDELGSERIIDIGEITSLSALSGYSNWIDGRVYNVDFTNFNYGIANIYKKKQQFIYYANADGSGDLSSAGYADGHYIESIHTYEDNCRLRIYLKSGYSHYITHDNILRMYPIETDTGDMSSYHQNEAIVYLRNCIDSYAYRQIPGISNQIAELTKFKSISTLAELKTYLTEEYNKHQGTKPVYVDFYNYYNDTLHTTPFVTKCVGTVFEESGSCSYKCIDITNQNSVYFAGYQNVIQDKAEDIKHYTINSASEFRSFCGRRRTGDVCIVTFNTDLTKGTYILYIDIDANEASGININGLEQITILHLTGASSLVKHTLRIATTGSDTGGL